MSRPVTLTDHLKRGAVKAALLMVCVSGLAGADYVSRGLNDVMDSPVDPNVTVEREDAEVRALIKRHDCWTGPGWSVLPGHVIVSFPDRFEPSVTYTSRVDWDGFRQIIKGRHYGGTIHAYCK